MFEVLKIFIEQAFKLINISALVNARKGTKMAELGVNMFELYSSLNRVFTCGLRIIDSIEHIISKHDQYKRENRLGEYIPAFDLDDLLQDQARNIVDFSHAFSNLSAAVDVMDPDAARIIKIFLAGKGNVVSELINMMNIKAGHATPMFGVSAEENLLEYITGKNAMAHKGKAEILELRRAISDSRARRAKAVAEECIDYSYGIPISKIPVLRRYLKERRPREHLDQLKDILQNLHDVPKRNFKLEDVLLLVGDRRLVRDKWPAHWTVGLASARLE
jgi:hypothetical protein